MTADDLGLYLLTEGLDPILLAAGIRAPLAKRTVQFGPAHKAKISAEMRKVRRYARTTEGIAQEQNRFGALDRRIVRVVRG